MNAEYRKRRLRELSMGLDKLSPISFSYDDLRDLGEAIITIAKYLKLVDEHERLEKEEIRDSELLKKLLDEARNEDPKLAKCIDRVLCCDWAKFREEVAQ